MARDIVTIGDSVVDIIISVPHFPVENEETVNSEGMQRQLGGSSNFLIMASRLGLKTGIIDRLGEDELAYFYQSSLVGEGVDVSQLMITSGSQTAHCICLVDQQGNHSYISFPGATYGLTKDQIEPDYISSSKALYISGYSLSREPIREATLKALDIAVENRLKIYLDPSPRVSLIPPETLQHVLQQAHGLFLNEREQTILASLLPEYNIENSHGFAALKQGDQGCTIYSNGEGQHFEAETVDVIDTTGAGDVFNAAFIYGDLKDWKLGDCARFANLLAEEKVKKLGAGLNVPTRAQAERLLTEIGPV